MSKEHPTIMVVEDENLLLQAITKKLKLSGMDVLSCSSGEQGIDYLKSLDALPDAVWLDYYLKDMNGLAFMEALKQDPRWASIPVVVVSNSASPDKVSHMLALGVKKYILKAEYRLDEIIAMIQEFISDGPPGGDDEGPGAGEGQPVAAPSPEQLAQAQPAAPAMPMGGQDQAIPQPTAANQPTQEESPSTPTPADAAQGPQ